MNSTGIASNTLAPDGSVVQASAQFQQPGAERLEIDIANAQAINREQLKLQDGSVVMIGRQPKRVVNVLGLVRLPAQIPIPPGEELMLLDAIAQAGGTTISFADKVQVVRRIPNNPQPVVIGVSLRAARNGSSDNLRLAPGDLVSVEETPTTLVIDTIRTFFRVGFSAALPGI
jgi:polysaccharide export outer membrane protein